MRPAICCVIRVREDSTHPPLLWVRGGGECGVESALKKDTGHDREAEATRKKRHRRLCWDQPSPSEATRLSRGAAGGIARCRPFRAAGAVRVSGAGEQDHRATDDLNDKGDRPQPDAQPNDSTQSGVSLFPPGGDSQGSSPFPVRRAHDSPKASPSRPPA